MTAQIHHLKDHKEEGWYPWSKVLEASNAALDEIMAERALKCAILQPYDALMDTDIQSMVVEHRCVEADEILDLLSAVAGAAATVGEDKYATVKVMTADFELIKKHYNRRIA